MSLHGSLETFALTDVLALLSSTHKTGELRVVGDRSQGSLWVDAGLLVQCDVSRASTPVDAVFELLRLPTGMFTFEQGLAAPAPGQPVSLDQLVADALERLAEWNAIAAIVPSSAVAVRLQPEVAGDVLMTAEQWKLLVTAVDGGTVAAVCERMGLGEFDACRHVRDLVDLGVVRVEEPSSPDEQPASPSAASAAVVSGEPPAADDDAAVEDDDDPLAALVAVVAASADVDGDRAGADAADAADAADDDDEDDAVVAEVKGAAEVLDVPLPGQPLPAWALGDDDDQPVARPARALHTVVAEVGDDQLDGGADDQLDGDIDGDVAATEAGDEAVSGELGDEPINRGLLLKFLSSVRS